MIVRRFLFLLMYLCPQMLLCSCNDRESNSTPIPHITYQAPTNATYIHEMYLEEAESVCKGNRIEKANPYSQNNKYHPIIIKFVSNDFEDFLYQRYPPKWYPDSLEDIQLIGCIEVDFNKIEYCEYFDTNPDSDIEKSIFRAQAIYSISVLEAMSGEKITSIKLEGQVPKPCPEFISLEHSQRISEEIPWNEVFTSLTGVVESE